MEPLTIFILNTLFTTTTRTLTITLSDDTLVIETRVRQWNSECWYRGSEVCSVLSSSSMKHDSIEFEIFKNIFLKFLEKVYFGTVPFNCSVMFHSMTNDTGSVHADSNPATCMYHS